MIKIKSRIGRRMGFSLIEMMVVIGILAILIAALLPFMGGSTDGADCVKCKNNMKSLALAVISCAQADDVHGHFPSAGYYRSITIAVNTRDSNKKRYYAHRPWISCKAGDYKLLYQTTRDITAGSPSSAFFTDSEETCRDVIEHGAIWSATGKTFGIYRCPIHEREFEKKNKRPPWWSYMMNKAFGYVDDTSKARQFCGKSIHDSFGGRGHDKVLMFAEVQGVEVNDKKNGISLKVASGDGTDPLLDYDNKSDAMGFNHRVGKKQYGGNVAFADGHVETIIYPKSGRIQELTKDLCKGVDVPRDGSYAPNTVDR